MTLVTPRATPGAAVLPGGGRVDTFEKRHVTHCPRAVALLRWSIVRKPRAHTALLVGAFLSVMHLVAGCDDLPLPAIIPDGGTGISGTGGAGGDTSTSSSTGGDDAITCAPPTTRCDHGCHDLSTSNEHCGSCEAPCTGGASCLAGSCVCAGGRTRCGEWCVDLDKDAAHCGACDHACGDDHVCSEGECVIGQCGDDLEECGGSCVDTKSDNQHCGGCNHACTGGASCKLGDCKCPFGEARCEDQCVDLDSDPKHCGECNNDCASGACTSGECEG